MICLGVFAPYGSLVLMVFMSDSKVAMKIINWLLILISPFTPLQTSIKWIALYGLKDELEPG